VTAAVEVVELRVLDGPNLYFPRPAIKLTMAVPGWIDAAEPVVERAAERLEVAGAFRAGASGTEQRRRAVMRIAATFTRKAALASGARRLAVRARPGPAPDQIVVAFPWRRRNAAQSLARETADAMTELRRGRSPGRLVAAAGARLADAEPGPEPIVIDPDRPVVQVTGTNGKTTTVRLLAHLVRSADLRVAFSSTDGVYRGDGVLVERGDYSGFGGAAMALAQRPDIAVLETARGGLLLRGSGVRHNDVAVVTNVSEDHLGLHGIDTVDQLAEVKGIVTRITRPDGWDVLNADDPRVLAMRRHATGRPWVFSLDPYHPSFREVLREGGRAMTVLDGRMTWLEGHRSHPIVNLLDVPVTIAGVSSIYTQNAMAAAAAGLAAGLPVRAVAKGLRTFVTDPARNPGRANIFTLDRRVVVIDYAHNEAGVRGLTELLNGLRPAGSDVRLAICTAGDRTDQILRAFAFRAAVGSDHLAVAELPHYLRGRTREDIVGQLRAGARDAGVVDVEVYDDELLALKGLFATSAPGDVISVTALGMRPEIFAWLKRRHAAQAGPADVKRLVRKAREARSRPAT
jgi:cyanophycin synthetase